MNLIEEKNIILNDQLIHYSFLDLKNNNNTIIFLHGWRSSGSIWLNFFDQLSKIGYSLYSLDLPGFGQSELPKTPFTIDDYVSTVSQFIKRLSLKKPVIIGHSFGGNIAIKLAVNNSDLLKSLVLIDSSGIRKKTMQKKAATLLAKIVKPFFIPSFMQPLRKFIYEKIGAEDYLATPQLAKTYLNIIQEDLTPALKKIKQKTLIVWGDRDPETPLDQAYILQKNIPNNKLVVLKNAGHFSFLDQKEEFIKTITNFIST